MSLVMLPKTIQVFGVIAGDSTIFGVLIDILAKVKFANLRTDNFFLYGNISFLFLFLFVSYL